MPGFDGPNPSAIQGGMDWMVPAAFFVAAAVATAVATRLLIPRLESSRVLDRPNQRSSHIAPTPRGGGLAVVPVAAVAWAAAGLLGDPGVIWVAVGALILCGLSWMDDLKGLPPVVRLAAHAAVVAVLLAQLPAEVLHFQGLLPLWADRLAAALAWIWFINLFNFMDGIDGISGVEMVAIGAGVVVAGIWVASVGVLAPPAAAVVGAGVGFLWWNWHPAKVFLGDAGSVPLGLMLGWLLLELAARGLWSAALILPLYYLADATFTILRRAARGAVLWQAHREHFYQRAVARGLTHNHVARIVAGGNACLLILAVASIWTPWPALAGAAFTTFVVLLRLRGPVVRA